MPRTKKAAGQAADSRNGRQAELATFNREKMPTIPRGLKRKASRDLWVSYWTDVISGFVAESETMIVERWIRNVDRYRELMDAFDGKPIYITKDENQDVVDTVENPAFRLAMKLDAAIRADEAQLGYGPKNRAALGIAIVQQQSSLADHNAKYSQPVPNSDEAAEDPRLIPQG